MIDEREGDVGDCLGVRLFLELEADRYEGRLRPTTPHSGDVLPRECILPPSRLSPCLRDLVEHLSEGEVLGKMAPQRQMSGEQPESTLQFVLYSTVVDAADYELGLSAQARKKYLPAG